MHYISLLKYMEYKICKYLQFHRYILFESIKVELWTLINTKVQEKHWGAENLFIQSYGLGDTSNLSVEKILQKSQTTGVVCETLRHLEVLVRGCGKGKPCEVQNWNISMDLKDINEK